MKRLTGFIILLIIFSSIASCTKKGSTTPKANFQPTTEKRTKEKTSEIKSKQPETSKKNIITLGETKGSKKSTETSNVEYIGGGTNFLKDRAGDFIIPEDFKIGKLQKKFDLDKTTYIQYEVIKKFLDSLKHGKVNKGIIEPVERESMVKLINYHLKAHQIPIFYRIGKIVTNNNLITANVRLIGKVGSTEGQVYLTSENKKWFIRNIQINFNALTERETTRKKTETKPFNPSTFEWMLKSNE